jgi:ferritin
MTIIPTLKDNTNKNKNPFASESVIKVLNYRIEQEEIGRLQTMLDKLKAFGEDKIALRLLDNELNS